MKIVMLPYQRYSEGARSIAQALQVRRYSGEERPQLREEPLVLNWGKGSYPPGFVGFRNWINEPNSVHAAINKLSAFRAMADAGVPCVDFTTERVTAEGWLARGETIAVVCRTKVASSEGNGIVIAREVGQIVDAPLYTKYARKVHEYRIHVMNGEVFYATKKAFRNNAEHGLVRSGDDVYFKHLEPGNYPSQVALDAAVGAVRSLGLNFGGVDVGVAKDGSVKVYEVNTAPGVGPRTTEAYKAAFKKHYGQYKNRNNVALQSI